MYTSHFISTRYLNPFLRYKGIKSIPFKSTNFLNGSRNSRKRPDPHFFPGNTRVARSSSKKKKVDSAFAADQRASGELAVGQ